MYASDPAAVVPAAHSRSPNRGSEPRDDDPIIAAIGGTPLVPLHRLVRARGGGFELYAKAEFLNPSGSVKDRAAWGIVRAALADGRLGSGRTLLDASSGNTAVSYALLGARLGFPVELIVPRTAHPDRVARIRSFGAAVSFSDPAEGTDGAQREARRRADAEPDRYFFADQYHNPANPDAHFRTTGPEIWRATEGRITHFVAGVGTGGTISGTARYLRTVRPSIQVIGVEPSGPMHGLEGLKHLPTALRPSTYDADLVDETRRVETEEALVLQERLAREEGLRVGASAGAAVAVALAVGSERTGSVVVTLLPDAGHPASEDGAP